MSFASLAGQYPGASDDIIHAIIHEIVKRCRATVRKRLFQARGKNVRDPNAIRQLEDEITLELEQDITEALAAFIVRSTIVDEANGFDVEKEFSKADVERLVEYSVRELIEEDSPRLETLRMQLLFDSSVPVEAEHLRKENAEKAAKLAPMLKDILDCQSKRLVTVEGTGAKR